jgi:hypothetical protein
VADSWPAQADGVLVTTIALFGRTVTYTPTVGAAFSLVGVFDREGSQLSIDGAQLEIASPRLGVRLADFAVAPGQGDVWEIDGVRYRVTAMIPDGQGGSMLFGEISA